MNYNDIWKRDNQRNLNIKRVGISIMNSYDTKPEDCEHGDIDEGYCKICGIGISVRGEIDDED